MNGDKPQTKDDLANMPSAATLFRMRLYDQASADLIRGAKEKLGPLLKLRYGGDIKRIQAAQTPEELLDLSPQATGLAQDAWHERMRSFGPQALPAIREILPQLRSLNNPETRYRLSALLVTELRWQGQPGAEALLDCLDDLDDAAAALALVVVGLSHLPSATEKVWRRYLKLKALSQESHFIAGLWALIDLGDRRVAAELSEFLGHERYFFELFGFLSLAGDEQSLPRLLALAMERGQNQSADPLMAATAIAHRLGKSTLIRCLLESNQTDPGRIGPQGQAQAEEIAAMILARSIQEVEEYFALFYRGFQPQDASAAFEFIHRNKD